MELKHLKVLITGGSSGIGKATAKLLVKHGAHVVITGRDKQKLITTADEIGASYAHFDMTDYASIQMVTEQVAETLGGIDVLINNAGIGEFNLLEEVTIDQFERVFSTNVFGLALLTKQCLPYLKQSSQAAIINIASTAALKGFAHGTVYSASKFALRGMTECWQAELRKENIRVMLINPSEVTTAFNQQDRNEREDVSNKLSSEEIAHSIKSVLTMDKRGFIPELTVWATNPFS